MKEDFLEAVTFKLRPTTFPGNLELEEGRVRGLKVSGGRTRVNTWNQAVMVYLRNYKDSGMPGVRSAHTA